MTRTRPLFAVLALLTGCSPPGADYPRGVPDDDDNAYDDDDYTSDDDDAYDEDDGSDEPPLEEPKEDPEDQPEECADAPEEPTTWYLSADDSNSQADVSHLRQLIEEGNHYPHSLRPWEFLNYYDFGYEPADAGHVRVVPQLRPVPGDDGAYSLLVGVVAPAMEASARPPLAVTLSVDTSCSMGSGGLNMAVASMEALASALKEGDVVSMVAWSESQSVLLDSRVVDGPDDAELVAAIDGLATDGSTNLNAGLVAAYDLASANYAPERINRVILLSDGGANVGVTQSSLIGEHADDAEAEAIYMVGVGTPPASEYNDELMDTVTDAGRGAYVYVDRPAEAVRAFGPGRIERTLAVAARSVRLELTLPSGVVLERFSGEEKSTDPEEVEPQHLSPNDAMLYHQVVRDCSEAEAADLAFEMVVTWEDPVTREPMTDSATVTLAELLEAPAHELAKADAILLYADTMQAIWDVEWDQREGLIAAALAEVTTVAAAYPDDADLAEVVDLLEQARLDF